MQDETLMSNLWAAAAVALAAAAAVRVQHYSDLTLMIKVYASV